MTDETQARAEARRLTEAHFRCRGDATRSVRAGFYARELARLQGEPVPGGKTRRRRAARQHVSGPTADPMTDLERLLAASLEARS